MCEDPSLPVTARAEEPAAKSRRSNAAGPLSRVELLAFALVIGILATLLHGYRYGYGNQLEQLPLVLRALDSSCLAGDYFVSAGATYGPRTYYSLLLAALGRLIPLPVVFFALTLGSHVLIAFVTCLMARTLFPGRDLAALLAAGLVMALDGLTLGDAATLHTQALIPQTLALPAALAALCWGFQGRAFRCAVMAAVASFIHPTVGLQTGLLGLGTGGLAALFGLGGEPRSLRQRLSAVGQTAVATVLLLVFAYLVWMRPLAPTAAATDFFAFYVRFRVPHHFIPSTFGRGPFMALGFFLIATAVAWKWWRDDEATDRAMAGRFLILLLALVGVLIGGYVFVELIPSRLWTSAQVYRLVFVIKWLGLILLGATAARWILSAAGERWTSGLLLLCATGKFQPMLACLALGAARVGRALPAWLSRVGAHLTWATVLLVAMIVIKTYAAGSELRAMGCFAIAAAWFLVVRRRWLRMGVPLVTVTLLLVAVLLNRVYPCPVLSDSQLPIVAELFDPKHLVLTVADGDGPGDGVGTYAREHLPEDAVCLTPPDFGRFRIVARRALVVDLKSVTFHEAGVREWYQRCVDCYGEPEGVGFAACRRWVADYHTISPQRVRMAAEKYGATHAVLLSETVTPLPVLYDDGAYKLVEISAGVGDHATSPGASVAVVPGALSASPAVD